jgi:hypothetical protein
LRRIIKCLKSPVGFTGDNHFPPKKFARNFERNFTVRAPDGAPRKGRPVSKNILEKNFRRQRALALPVHLTQSPLGQPLASNCRFDISLTTLFRLNAVFGFGKTPACAPGDHDVGPRRSGRRWCALPVRALGTPRRSAQRAQARPAGKDARISPPFDRWRIRSKSSGCKNINFFTSAPVNLWRSRRFSARRWIGDAGEQGAFQPVLQPEQTDDRRQQAGTCQEKINRSPPAIPGARPRERGRALSRVQFAAKQ